MSSLEGDTPKHHVRTNSSAVLPMLKELEEESTMVYEVFPILGVRLRTLFTWWGEPTQLSFSTDVTCMLDILDARQHSKTVAELRQYYAAVTEKWYQTVQSKLPEELKYTSESFSYYVGIRTLSLSCCSGLRITSTF